MRILFPVTEGHSGRGLLTFSIMGQIVNVVSFAGYVVSDNYSTLPLYHKSRMGMAVFP